MIKLRFNFKLISKDNEKICNRQGRFFLSNKFKDWEREVKFQTQKQYHDKPLIGDVELTISAYFKNKVHADTTNLFKGLCDALQGVIYNNDKQIKIAAIEVIEKCDKEYFEVNLRNKLSNGVR